MRCCRPARALSQAVGRAGAPRDCDTRQKFRKMLREGKLDDARSRSRSRCHAGGVEIMAPPGMEEMSSQLQGMFQNLGGSRTRRAPAEGARAFKLLVDEEAAQADQRRGDPRRALQNAEQNGIVFIDEIDKVTRVQ
jgi:ATP-dependent HslUV protease ATP-binding subunit HslU